MSAASPNILLFGATGQLGGELAVRLAPLGNLTVAARGKFEPTAKAAALAVDLADEAQVRSAVRQVEPQLVVNAAAYTAVDRAETDRDVCWRVNALAPGWIADEAAQFSAALVHYSTDYVFDGSGSRPWREDDPTGPLNYYGLSKLAGEQAIRDSGVSHLIMRTSWVYGAQGHNFVATMLRLGQQKTALNIVDDQFGAPTSADVLADVTLELINRATGCYHEWFRAHGGLLHVACQGETTWHEFAGEIFRLARAEGVSLAVRDVAPIATANYPTPARRPLNSRLDMTRLAEQFGLVTPHWTEALAQTFPAIAVPFK